MAADQIPEKLLNLHQRIAPRSTSRPDASQLELALLSTCNRTEIYCNDSSNNDISQTQAQVMQSVSEWSGVPRKEIQPHWYQLTSEQAAKHAFRVASGLDSMVVGETQILGQMKTAVRTAQEVGTLGANLHGLFSRSFSVAKEVRTATTLGQSTVSLAAAVARLVERVFGSLSQTQVLFVGAGQMIELTATHLHAQTPRSVYFANRTEDRALALTERFNAKFLPLSQMPESLHSFDVVVSCTASSVPIIGLGAVKRAIKLRRNRPMLFVDLAVPRDIEPEVRSVPNVFMYNLDDLSGIVQQGKEQRQTAVAQAEAIVQSSVDQFMQWLAARSSAPLLQTLNQRVEAIRTIELDKALRALQTGQSPDKVVEALSRGLIGKIMHPAFRTIRAEDPEQRQLTERVLRKMWTDPQL